MELISVGQPVEIVGGFVWLAELYLFWVARNDLCAALIGLDHAGYAYIFVAVVVLWRAEFGSVGSPYHDCKGLVRIVPVKVQKGWSAVGALGVAGANDPAADRGCFSDMVFCLIGG